MRSLLEIMSSDVISKNVDYNKFIDSEWKQVQNKPKEQRAYGQYICNWVTYGVRGAKLFVCLDNTPLGYLWVQRFKDGYSVKTVGVKQIARGTGVSNILYDMAVSKTKLYSDKDQSPQARKLWGKLYKKYNVMGYSDVGNKTFKVQLNGAELQSADPKYVLYTDQQEQSTRLVII